MIKDTELLEAAMEVPRFDGNCRGFPTDWWFPDRGQSGQHRANTVRAVEICNGCHAKEECLSFSLYFPLLHGIWGGMSQRQRQKERARRRIVVDARKNTGAARNVRSHFTSNKITEKAG